MVSIKNKDKIRLDDILNAIKELEEACEDTAKERTKEMAFAFAIAVIGEAVKNISNELKEKYSEVPWRDIADTRNKLIHEYAKIDKNLLNNIVEVEIPKLKIQIQEIIKNYDN
ncbi:MAG: HepT-like ribonuclease domain-containing protein [Rickettsiales bacterium]|nr:HepT-like ribonuclease domain-containing protein [Rickettsiales bacterium]